MKGTGPAEGGGQTEGTRHRMFGLGRALALVGAGAVLGGSLMLLGHFLRLPVRPVSGRGWGTEEACSERLRRCCEFLEEALASHKERLSPGLLEGVLLETETDTWVSLLAEAEELYGAGLSGEKAYEQEAYCGEGLSAQERLLYGKLRYCRDRIIAQRALPDYESLLSEFSGILQKTKEEYYIQSFEERRDAEEYLEWLEAQGGALEETARRLEGQQALKDFYSEESIEKARLSYERLWGREGLLHKGFRERLAACAFLSEEEKRELLSRQDRIEEEKLSPALKELEVQLSHLQGAEYSRGLCSYPEGGAYYDDLLERSTGAGMNAEEMFRYLEEARTGELFSCEPAGRIPEEAGGKGALSAGTGGPEERGGSAEDILEELYRHAREAYPSMKEAGWEIVKLPEDFFGRVSRAFYVKSGERNRIYVGEDFEWENRLAAVQVLAHEGFPGHALSHNGGRAEEYPILEQALRFPGYEEGWAVRAELAAADWLEEGQAQYREMVLDSLYGELVLAQMDIGIHGLGWTMEELEDFAEGIYGEEGRGVGTSLWNLLADNPCMYQPYAAGYCRLAGLERECAGQGMETQEFVRKYLECGQAPFALAEEWLLGTGLHAEEGGEGD